MRCGSASRRRSIGRAPSLRSKARAAASVDRGRGSGGGYGRGRGVALVGAVAGRERDHRAGALAAGPAHAPGGCSAYDRSAPGSRRPDAGRSEPDARSDPLPASTDEPAPSPRARSGSRDPGRPEPSATEDAGASVGDELRAELVLIGKARRALQADDPQRALELLDAHARAFPQGQMREDRQVLRIEALCAADKGQQARAEARQLLRTYPGSAHAGRVREACPTR